MLCVPLFQSGDGLACQNLDPLFSIIFCHELGKLAGEKTMADSIARKNHHHFFPVHCQGGCYLRTDEPVTNDRETFVVFRKPTQPAIIRQRSVIDDSTIAERQTSRRPSRGQKQFVEGINVPLIIKDALRLDFDSLGNVL